MNIDNAIQMHAQWKFKLREALFNKQVLDAKGITRDDQCDLGKWLHGEAKVLYSTQPAYRQCVAEHAAFHAEVGKVVAAINQQDRESAERLLSSDSAFGQVSKKIAASLIELKLAMKG